MHFVGLFSLHPKDVSAPHPSSLDTCARLHLLRARAGAVGQLLHYVAERAALQCGCGAAEGTQQSERCAVRVRVLWVETARCLLQTGQ